MTKVNIISGFLGAGKTTFIKRLIADVFKGEKLVLIENEFGEIGVDGGFLQDAGIEITEMNSGCICCTLVGDFTKALKETVETYNPDRIIIEPSGVGKLSDVIAAVNNTGDENIAVDSCITVVDCTKAKMYVKNFGEFYEDQILYSNCILLTRTDKANEAKITQAVEIIREINKDANIITTHLDKLDNAQILDAFKKGTMEEELLAEAMKAHHEHDHHHEHGESCSCGHDHHHEHGEHCSCGHDHHHEHGEHCSCGHDHHHEHGEHCSCGHDHHHEHGEHCSCGHDHHHEHGETCSCGHDHNHDHHHEHGESCSCGHDHHHEHGEHCSCGHDHHHEHGEHCSCGHDHHADEVFTAWGFETAKNYTEADIRSILTTLDGGEYGDILRAKGMVADGENWIYFDYVPEEHEIRNGAPCYTGKICVIGANLKEDKLAELFNR